MSHSYGKVRCEDGTIFHIEYNGTADVCLPNLYKTEDEVEVNWRKQEWKGCSCKPITLEPVELVTTYGGGWHWPAFICRKCMVITDRFTPFDESGQEDYRPIDGLPDWYPNKEF